MIKHWLDRVVDRFKFTIERYILAGVPYQVAIFGLIVIGVSFVAGLGVHFLTDEFANLWEGVWWAFLRLTDPGYLGDDEGTVKRVISTFLTVLGYVIFLGALITLMTQWMYKAIRDLEKGTTPLHVSGHVLVLGMTNRTASIIKELLASREQYKRHYGRLASKGKVVVLSEEMHGEVVRDLKDELGPLWRKDMIIIRGGSSLRIEDLRRVNFLKASSIIIPGDTEKREDAQATDARNIKTLLTIANAGQVEGKGNVPPIVMEILSRKKAQIAEAVYHRNTEIINSDSMVGRLMAQNARYAGLVRIYSELFRHRYGNEMHIEKCEEAYDQTFENIRYSFPKATILGIIRKDNGDTHPLLNPPRDTVYQSGDELLFMAQEISDCVYRPASRTVGQRPAKDRNVDIPPIKRRVLILGWNHLAPGLIQEFCSFPGETFEVVSMGPSDPDQRKDQLAQFDIDYKSVGTTFLRGDFTLATELKKIEPDSFTDIYVLGADHDGVEEESDARTILCYLLLKDMLKDVTEPPDVLLELADPENARLFPRNQDEIIVPHFVLGHILAQVATTPQINDVYEILLGRKGNEISVVPLELFGIPGGNYLISELEKHINSTGNLFMGYVKVYKNRLPVREYFLNPRRLEIIDLQSMDGIIIMT